MQCPTDPCFPCHWQTGRVTDHVATAAGIYAETRSALIERCASLSIEQGERTVPLTPPWRVKDVVAHVCGINADFLAGRLEGIGSDEWTQRQIDERRGMSLSDICQEWAGYAPNVDAVLTAQPDLGPRLLGDLIVHVHDVDHALGVEPDRSSPATIVGARRYGPHLQDRVLDKLDVGLALDLGSAGIFDAPIAGQPLRLVASPYEFLRAVTGRRSRAQVAALGWHGDQVLVDRLIDSAISSYGPLQPTDVAF